MVETKFNVGMTWYVVLVDDSFRVVVNMTPCVCVSVVPRFFSHLILCVYVFCFIHWFTLVLAVMAAPGPSSAFWVKSKVRGVSVGSFVGWLHGTIPCGERLRDLISSHDLFPFAYQHRRTMIAHDRRQIDRYRCGE